MVTKVTSSNFAPAVNNIITAAGAIPTISGITPTNSSYITTGNSVVDPTSPYIKILGANFASGAQVYIDSTPASTVTFIGSTQLNVIAPSISSGSYVVYVINPDGSVAIRINGITYSTSPVWSTSGSLPGVVQGSFVSIQLSAVSDSTVTYSVVSGSLPTGLSLSTSGLLSGTPTGLTVDTTYNFTVNATDAENQINNSSFSVSITVTDPYFNLVSLALTGDISSTTCTTDASTNNADISISGDARADRYSPYYGNGYYSNYFDGSGDYLSLPSNQAQFSMGTGDFTIEMWVNILTFQGQVTLYDTLNSGDSTGTGRFALQVTTGGVIQMFTTAGTILTSGGTLASGIWYHIAYVRIANSGKLYVNGTQVNTTYADNNNYVVGTSNRPIIGINGYDSSSSPMYGNISNLRVVKGTGVYTGSFTPSPTPLTAITGTSLLTCQSNRLIDISSNNFVITKGADTTVSPAVPFAVSSTYATYGSAYFDGTGDYLTVPSASAYTFAGDFTIEAWVNPRVINTNNNIIARWTSSLGFIFKIVSSGRPYFAWYIGGTGTVTGTTTSVIVNQWNHVAVTRSGTTVRLFVNGVLDSTTGTASGVFNSSTSAVTIGSLDTSGSEPWTGYLSDVRLINGTALYTTSFTPSIVPLTAVTNTQLLTLQYNGSVNNNSIVDNSPNNTVLTRIGTVTQGSFTPYSPNGWAIYFNGTGGLQTPSSSLTNIIGSSGLITSTFTIECWINPTTRSGSSDGSLVGDMVPSAGSNNWSWGPRNDGRLNFNWYTGSTNNCTGSSVIQLNVWTHIALVITTTSIRMFVNGIQETLSGTTTLTAPSSSLSYLGLGMWNSGSGGNNTYIGYVSNLRIVQSALYSANFTPSTTMLTAIANTSLLIAQSNRFSDNSTNAYRLTVTGNPSVQSYSPFPSNAVYNVAQHGGSVYFTGANGSGIRVPAPGGGVRHGIYAGDFALQFWIYSTDTVNNSYILDYGQQGANSLFVFFSNNAFYVRFNGSVSTGWDSTAAPGLGATFTWTHISVKRQSGLMSLYVNGIAASAPTTGSASNSTDIGTTASGEGNILSYNSFGTMASVKGYVCDFEFSRQASSFPSSNFTPPTAPIAPSARTMLMLNCNNGGVIDARTANIIETVGNARASTKVKKYGNSSLYFDGTTGKLTIPASPQHIFGTGDFTVEFWMNTADTAAGLITPATTGAGYWALLISSGTLYWQNAYNSSNLKTASLSGYLTNTWVHIAVVRNSGNLYFYFNGTAQGTATVDSTNYSGVTNALTIGYDSQTNGYYSGYIDDLRITKGYARYTSSFTAPVTGFLTR